MRWLRSLGTAEVSGVNVGRRRRATGLSAVVGSGRQRVAHEGVEEWEEPLSGRVALLGAVDRQREGPLDRAQAGAAHVLEHGPHQPVVVRGHREEDVERVDVGSVGGGEQRVVGRESAGEVAVEAVRVDELGVGGEVALHAQPAHLVEHGADEVHAALLPAQLDEGVEAADVHGLPSRLPEGFDALPHHAQRQPHALLARLALPDLADERQQRVELGGGQQMALSAHVLVQLIGRGRQRLPTIGVDEGRVQCERRGRSEA